MAQECHRIGDPNVAGGTIISVLQAKTLCEGVLVSVNGSPVSGHSPFEPPHVPTGTPKTSNGSAKVLASGIPVNRQGDPDTCGHPRAAGATKTFVHG